MFEYLKDFKYQYPDRKLYSLIDKVYDLENLKTSWKHVKANKGCAGMDKQSILYFAENEEFYLRELSRAVKQGKYTATPVLRKYIPKADGRMRPLGIPIIKDRILQQAARNVIEGIFEMKFLNCSFGFRPEKSAHQAIAVVEQSLKEGNLYVVDADIKSFFDNVNHERLMGLIAEEVSDGRFLNLIDQWLRSGLLEDGKYSATSVGTPQGGVISPLLANIYLHEMDTVISKIPGLTLVRYADDFVILSNCKWRAEYARNQAKKVLATLGLELHPEKTRIVNTSKEEFEFLGFRFGMKRGHFRKVPRNRSVEKFKESVRHLTRRKQPIAPKEMVGRLNYTIRGWGQYFKIGNVATLFSQLDVWTRMRVRCFIEKRKSRYSTERIPNHVLQAEYKLSSLMTLLPRSL